MKYQLAFLTADIFATFGALPLSRLRAYTLQDATFYPCSCLYTGNFTISTVKSRYSHCFNCQKTLLQGQTVPPTKWQILAFVRKANLHMKIAKTKSLLLSILGIHYDNIFFKAKMIL